MKPYRVHVGCTPSGKDRWRRFATLEAASAFCGQIFKRHGIVLSITKLESK